MARFNLVEEHFDANDVKLLYACSQIKYQGFIQFCQAMKKEEKEKNEEEEEDEKELCLHKKSGAPWWWSWWFFSLCDRNSRE